MIKSYPTHWRLPRISQPQAKNLFGITMLAPREGASPSGSKTWQTRHAQDSPHSRADALTHAPETAGSSHGDLSETTNDPTRHKLWTQKTQDSKLKSSVTDTDGLCSAPGPRLSPSARPPASSPCQAPGIPPPAYPPLPGPRHPSPARPPASPPSAYPPLPGPRHPSPRFSLTRPLAAPVVTPAAALFVMSHATHTTPVRIS